MRKMKFKVVAVVEYVTRHAEKGDIELEAEDVFIRQLGDNLVQVYEFDCSKVCELETDF